MERYRAYRILKDMEVDCPDAEMQEALRIALHDVEFVDLLPNDMIPVVRCGECKYCVFHCGAHFCIKLKAFPVVETDDFCSYGERREDDADPVAHARWEINPDGYYPYCSNCKAEPKSGKMTPTCPNCGAKMDLEVDGE